MNPTQLPKASASAPTLSMQALAKSLGSSSSRLDVDQDVMEKFKAAALSITTLYRASRASSQRAYNNGYASALEDLRSICADVARSEGNAGDGGPQQVARVLHWIDARLEAVRLESREDEDEDDAGSQNPRLQQQSRTQYQHQTSTQSNVQTRTMSAKNTSGTSGGNATEPREKSKVKAPHSSSATASHTGTLAATDGTQLSQTPRESRTSNPASVPTTGDASIAVTVAAASSPSSSPSPVLTARTQPRTRLRATKESSSSVESAPPSDSTPSALNVRHRTELHPFRDPNAMVPAAAAAAVEGAESWTLDRNPHSLIGAKRRYAAMALESASSPYGEFGMFDRPATASIALTSPSTFSSPSASSLLTGNCGAPSTRRRLRERSSRNSLHSSPAQSIHAAAPSHDEMDVEEEQGGRERKRIARR